MSISMPLNSSREASSAYFCRYHSPLGEITLAADEHYLTGLWFVGQKYYAANHALPCVAEDRLPVFTQIRDWLDAYFSGLAPLPNDLPLQPRGSEFRLAVWRRLCQIPYGECVTYGTVARDVTTVMGKPGMSAQATGGAVGHNPISLIIPCHRVIGSNNSLTGYAGGIARKMQLLKLEGVDITSLTVPARGTAL